MISAVGRSGSRDVYALALVFRSRCCRLGVQGITAGARCIFAPRRPSVEVI